MGKPFYDITLYFPKSIDSKELSLKQGNISAMYVHFLNGYKPTGVSRISVGLGDYDQLMERRGSSILRVYSKFDEVGFKQSSESEQNKIILDTIHRVAIQCAEQLNWEKEVFENAYQKVQEADYVYAIEDKRKFSKNKKHKASLLIKRNGDCAMLSALFFDKEENKLNEVELLRTFVYPGDFSYKNKWFSNQEFGLHFEKEQLVIKASILSSEPEILIQPKTASKEEIELYLDKITYQEINSQEDLVKYMNW